MAKLASEVRTFIVQQLAAFYTHSEVREAVKERFDGLDVTLSQIGGNDPETVLGERDLAKKWKRLHAETRQRFLDQSSAIPIANRSYRLRELQDAVREAKRMRNFVLVKELLEQAAKEVGDVFTNRRLLTAGDPVKELAALLGVGEDDVRDLVEDPAGGSGVGAGA